MALLKNNNRIERSTSFISADSVVSTFNVDSVENSVNVVSPYKFNKNMGLETLYIEYKAFTFFSSGIKLSNEDCQYLLENKKWIFNNIVMENIFMLIKLYLPKYFCGYLSNNMSIDSILYFGVSDIGDINGIPYQGVINIDVITNQCKKILLENISCSHLKEHNILEMIDIQLINLNYGKQIINNIHPDYQKYLKYIKNYELQKIKYIKKKIVWDNLNDRYNSKLSDIVNNIDTRIELINYIENYDEKNKVIKLLKTNFIMPNIASDSIKNLKISSDSIYYWVTEFKDNMLKFIKVIKPRFNYKIPCNLYPVNIIGLISSMIPYWFSHNENMNLYFIKIIFKKNIKLNIKYKNIYNEWITCKRTTNKHGPCCIPSNI